MYEAPRVVSRVPITGLLQSIDWERCHVKLPVGAGIGSPEWDGCQLEL